MKCKDCLYYYRDEEEGFSRCHFEWWGLAPCEEDDDDDFESDTYTDDYGDYDDD